MSAPTVRQCQLEGEQDDSRKFATIRLNDYTSCIMVRDLVI